MIRDMLRILYRQCKYQSGCKVLYSTNINEGRALYISKVLNTPKTTADYLCLKYPMLLKLDTSLLESTIKTVTDLGLSKDILVEEPLIFSISPITLQHRCTVLQECGLHDITGYHLAHCLNIIKNKTIQELKNNRMLMPSVNVENRLASYMTQWPTSLTTLIQCDINKQTLYKLRLKIIQKYLELMLDLSEEEFDRALHTYPTIKLRPLQMINESLNLLLNIIDIPPSRIKSNMYLVHANSKNLKLIIYHFKSIGGIDIKDILRMYPKLCMTNYSNLEEIRSIFQEFQISNEAQIRCLRIYTLAPKTIRERLRKATQTPEFQVYLNHPRFLKIILYNKNATKRVLDMYKTNKKCLSLNSLSGCTDDFRRFIKAPGDRSGKGKDLLYCIAQELGKQYSISDVRKKIKKHPFWINIPLVHVKLVYEKLSPNYSSEEIFENCPILLYPLQKVKDIIKLIESKNNNELCKLVTFFEHTKIDKLNKSQILSLTLYILEKKHYFSGNGVWTDDKIREASQHYYVEQNKFSDLA